MKKNLLLLTFVFSFGCNPLGNTSSVSLSYNPGLGTETQDNIPTAGVTWIKSATASLGTESDFRKIAVQSDGSIIVAANLNGLSTYNFGNSIMATGNNSSTSLALVKYSSAGIPQWVYTLPIAGGRHRVNDIKLDSSGNIFIAGSLEGNKTFDFGNGISFTSGTNLSNAGYVAKFNASGVPQWVSAITVTAASTVDSAYRSLALDSSGNIYIAVYINSSSVFNLGNGVTHSALYAFGSMMVAKYNSSGQAQWAVGPTVAPNNTNAKDIVCDSSGNVYMTFTQRGTSAFSFGSGISSSGSYTSDNISLIKYNSAGSAQWVRTATMSAGGASDALAINTTGTRIYFGGYFYGSSISFSGVTATSTKSWNSYLVAYDNTGTALWAKGQAGDAQTEILSIASDSAGNVYAGGDINNAGQTADFGNSVTLTASGPGTPYVVKYNSAGVAQKGLSATATNITGDTYGTSRALAIPATGGGVIVAGYLYGITNYSFETGYDVSGIATNSVPFIYFKGGW